jgi:uncharacterized protein involved in cysteine biosynthesis
MAGMIASFAKAVGQLTDPRLARIILYGLAATILLYVILSFAVGWALHHFLYRVDIFGWHPLTIFTEVASWIAIGFLTLLLFPAVATTTLSFMLESVCAAVEGRYYPSLGPARKQGFVEMLWQAVRFMAVLLLINLLVLPVYIGALIIFGAGAALYFIVNGYLLGREYFELVAMRRLPQRDADALRRAHSGRIWLGGIVLAFVSTVPILNLLAPVIGTAAMLHEFEALRTRDE